MRQLNLLQLGDELASGLGMKVTRVRFYLLTVAAILIAPVVAVTGPIGFVALLSPHMVRMLLRTSNAYSVLPTSALAGGLVLIVADTLARLLFFPLEIPVGVWTIAVIGPVVLWLASSKSRQKRFSVAQQGGSM